MLIMRLFSELLSSIEITRITRSLKSKEDLRSSKLKTFYFLKIANPCSLHIRKESSLTIFPEHFAYFFKIAILTRFQILKEGMKLTNFAKSLSPLKQPCKIKKARFGSFSNHIAFFKMT